MGARPTRRLMVAPFNIPGTRSAFTVHPSPTMATITFLRAVSILASIYNHSTKDLMELSLCGEHRNDHKLQLMCLVPRVWLRRYNFTVLFYLYLVLVGDKCIFSDPQSLFLSHMHFYLVLKT